jgi:hypothetical protein
MADSCLPSLPGHASKSFSRVEREEIREVHDGREDEDHSSPGFA